MSLQIQSKGVLYALQILEQMENYPKTEKEYRQYDAMNFSSLSKLSDGPKWYRIQQLTKDPADWDKPYFHVGSAFDVLLTEGEEAFEREFIVGTVEPTNQRLTDFCTYYVHSLWEGFSKEVSLQNAKRKSGYKITVSALKAKIEEEVFETYIKEKLQSKDKGFLFPSQKEMVQRMYNNFKETPEVSKWFTSHSDDFGIERFFQKPIIFYVNGIRCKALLDCIYIDHNKKEIYPIDLKTTSKSVENFNASFEKYKYYLQASFYTEAIKQWIEVQSETARAVGAGTDFEGYTIKPFMFAVCEKNVYAKPLMYVCSEKTLKCGQSGGVLKNNTYVKGYEQLLYDMVWHQSTNLWDFPKELYETSLVKELDVFQ